MRKMVWLLCLADCLLVRAPVVAAAETRGSIQVKLDTGDLPVINGAVTLYQVGVKTENGYRITEGFGGGIVRQEDADSDKLAQWLAETAGETGITMLLDADGNAIATASLTISNGEDGILVDFPTLNYFHTLGHSGQTYVYKIVEEDFSYNIGEQLKRIFYISLTKVLASFSNINTEDMLELLSEGPNSQNEIDHSIKDFISEKIKSFIECSDDIHQSIHEKTQNDNIDKTLLELLCSKIKNTIINTKLEITNTEEPKTDKKLSESVMQKLWSYRLYDNPTDKIVRMGDIIRKKDDVNYEKLYLILTDNCKLHRFNKKTNGLWHVA